MKEITVDEIIESINEFRNTCTTTPSKRMLELYSLLKYLTEEARTTTIQLLLNEGFTGWIDITDVSALEDIFRSYK